MNDEIMVSICCITYNHEKYISQALDSFLMQKTNFKYEIIIHDDASTDNTANIIREYEKKYPDIIKPIYEEENQYSKGNSIMRIAIQCCSGRYIALCEGDDYWCDSRKLQKQFEYMENNKECSMCLHNTQKHDLLRNTKDKKFNNWKDIHIMTEKDIFFGWKVHTSSYFMRKELAILPIQFDKYWFGDYVYLTTEYFYGKIAVLPEVMSVYNYNNRDGVTYKNYSYNMVKEKNNARKDYLIQYNIYTNNKYNKIVRDRINEIEFMNLILELNISNKTKKDFKIIKKKILSHVYFKKYIKSLNYVQIIKTYIKLSSYNVYVFFNKLKNL